jgi:hypothetical protein
MSTFYASRSNPNVETNDESYSTMSLYLSSQILAFNPKLTPSVFNASIPLAGYSNINAGFTVILANPIILDIGHRYVMTLIKSSIDVSQYTDRYYNFGFYCDLLEYQYQYNIKSQLLYQSFANKYVSSSGPTDDRDRNPAITEIPANVAWKFINPTQKVIKEISIWVLDDTGQPLQTPPTVLPQTAISAYPTNLNILIKKVNSHVIAVSQL